MGRTIGAAPRHYTYRTVMMSQISVAFSVDEAYFSAAEQELRDVFPGAAVERLGPDLGRLADIDRPLAEIAVQCRHWPVVFVRHLMTERAFLALAQVRRDKQAVSRAVLPLIELADSDVALQIWPSGEAPLSYGSEELWHSLADALRVKGIAVRRSGGAQTLGLCLTATGIVVGLNAPVPGYADWPGGRIRLRRSEEQISRSEFKLEELFGLDVAPIPDDGLAVDLGAAPGGWTRLLRRRGLYVIAVDPGRLDPRLDGDPGIDCVPTTTGPFLESLRRPVDLVVNDMRMAPALSCALMQQAALHVRPGGYGIMTLKLTPTGAAATIDAALGALRREWEIVFARQLTHNRNEVTVVLRRA